VGTALNLLPGGTASQVGARNEGFIYVRGLDVRHVPVFLDGIPIYVPYDGYPDLNRFTTFDLSEIDLTKGGFASVLYGPNTMGGAINLISKKPEKIFEGNAGLGWFTGNGYETYLNVGTNQKLWYAQAGASYLNSDYFVLSRDFAPVRNRPEDGGQRENSYQWDRKYNVKFGLTPADGHEYAVSYWQQHGVKGVPPYAGTDSTQQNRFWRWPYWDKEGYYLNTKTPLGEKSYIKSRFYYDTYQNSLAIYSNSSYTAMASSAAVSFYDDYTYGGTVELGTSFIPRNLLKLATHYKGDVHREHDDPRYPEERTEEKLFSIGAEDTITITDKFYTILGVSYDKQDTVKAETYNSTTRTMIQLPKGDADAWNPQAGFFYSFTDKRKINFTVSQKTRFATIKDKYSYRFGTAIPNPDLKPEKATAYEIGYQDVLFTRVALKTALFYRDIKDYIQQFQLNPTTAQNQNIGHVEQNGFEIELNAPIISTLEGGISYTYLNMNNRSTSDKLTDVPEHKLFFYAKYSPFKGFALLGDMEVDSQRYSSTNGVRIAKGFSLVNAKAMYEFYKGLQLEGGVRNIFDKNYALNEGFPMAGRTYFTNRTYRF
jgi:iron complex outermembrane recepter protein